MRRMYPDEILVALDCEQGCVRDLDLQVGIGLHWVWDEQGYCRLWCRYL